MEPLAQLIFFPQSNSISRNEINFYRKENGDVGTPANSGTTTLGQNLVYGRTVYGMLEALNLIRQIRQYVATNPFYIQAN